MLLGASGCGSNGGSGLRVRAFASSFTIAITDGHGGATKLGGKTAPSVFWTRSGAEHSATKVLRQVTHGATTTYTVATDEPGQTAVVSVRRASQAVHIDYAIKNTFGAVAVVR